MIKYFLKSNVSQMVSFDTETEEINSVDYMNSRVDWMYNVPADGTVIMNDVEKAVKKGDIVIKFYRTNDYKQNPYVVIRSKEWKQNLDAARKFEEERQKEYENAKLNKLASCENCCCDECAAA